MGSTTDELGETIKLRHLINSTLKKDNKEMNKTFDMNKIDNVRPSTPEEQSAVHNIG